MSFHIVADKNTESSILIDAFPGEIYITCINNESHALVRLTLTQARRLEDALHIAVMTAEGTLSESEGEMMMERLRIE